MAKITCTWMSSRQYKANSNREQADGCGKGNNTKQRVSDRDREIDDEQWTSRNIRDKRI